MEGEDESDNVREGQQHYSLSATQVISITITGLDGTGQVHLPRVYSCEEEANQWPNLQDLLLHHADIKNAMLLIGQDCPDTLVQLTTVPGNRGEP